MNDKKGIMSQAGSTLVTTLVAITFLLILATLLLSASAMNIQTKYVDYEAKRGFYRNEEVLEDIYNGIGQQVSRCMGRAYTDVLNQVTNRNQATYATNQEAYDSFCVKFVDYLKTVYSPDISKKDDIKKILNQYARAHLDTDGDGVMDADNPIEVVSIGNIIIEDNGAVPAVPTRFIFKDLEVTFREYQNGGTAMAVESTIITDIVIDMPYVTFFDDFDPLPDYALIANQGIYFSEGTRAIIGNLYGGLSSSPEDAKYGEKNVYGGINSYKSTVNINGKYIISKGDINVTQGSFSVGDSGEESNLWAETLRTTKNTTPVTDSTSVTSTGNTFLANDLELNSDKSSLKLTGAFYGYNNGVYQTQEKKKLETDTAKTREHTQSSSIIVNGREAQLDLSGLNTLLIAGRAYLDMDTKDNQAEPGRTATEQPTGESLALKSNQYMYLVPDEFLPITNPATQADAAALGIDHNSLLPFPTGTNWFAEGWLDAGKPIQIKTIVTEGGETIYYFYLNFKPGFAKQYAEAILSVNQAKVDSASGPQKVDLQWQLIQKEKLQEKSLQLMISSITVNAASGCRIYGLGAISQVEENTKELSAVEILPGMDGTEYAALMSAPMTKRYQSLFYYLNPQENYPLTSPYVTFEDPAVGGFSEDKLPLEKYVDLNALLLNAPSEANRTVYQANPDYKSILVAGNHTITSNVKGIVIATGDVLIRDGASIEGLVLAGGKIKAEGSGSITANRGIVQEILQEEQKIEGAKTPGSVYNPNYASCYMKNYTAVQTGISEAQKRDVGSEYVSFMSYQNWRKGGRN